MFEDVMKNFKLMSKQDKRKEVLSELKIVVAVLEKLCVDNKLEYRIIRSEEILDLNNGLETEDDYLESLLVYIEYLKEVVGTLLKG